VSQILPVANPFYRFYSKLIVRTILQYREHLQMVNTDSLCGMYKRPMLPKRLKDRIHISKVSIISFSIDQSQLISVWRPRAQVASDLLASHWLAFPLRAISGHF
jgi:hypothetical protein